MTPARPAASEARRCPACGQLVVSAAATACGLCGFKLGFSDDRATGDDATPYARAYTLHQPGWRLMAEWVWFAGTQRLRHLALMRSSAASRRFAWLNVLLMASASALFQASRVGWRRVTDSPAVEPSGSTRPRGQGWLHVAGTPRPLPPDFPEEVPVDLWWNPVHTVLGAVAAWVSALLLTWAAMALIRAGVTRAHARPYRREERMTAAIHYGSAWGILGFFAGVAASLRPIGYFGSIARWSWYPPERLALLAGGVLSGLGAVMAWFWTVRLGASAPASTRGRVMAFWLAGAPLIVGAVAALWWFGLAAAYDPLFSALGVSF